MSTNLAEIVCIAQSLDGPPYGRYQSEDCCTPCMVDEETDGLNETSRASANQVGHSAWASASDFEAWHVPWDANDPVWRE